MRSRGAGAIGDGDSSSRRSQHLTRDWQRRLEDGCQRRQCAAAGALEACTVNAVALAAAAAVAAVGLPPPVLPVRDAARRLRYAWKRLSLHHETLVLL